MVQPLVWFKYSLLHRLFVKFSDRRMMEHMTEQIDTGYLPGSTPVLPAGFEDNFGWLLAQCFRAHVTAMDHALTDLPHGHRGFQALSGAVNRSARNQAELAKQLGVDRTVMVYLIDDLERAGLVERVADPADRRSKLIQATAAGRSRLCATELAISAAEAELLAALSADDQQRLRTMLREIARHHVTSFGAGNACEVAAQVRGEESAPC
jgi:MarR family transcriptional regulator, transcriptional regulator for hemolysin